MDSSDHLRALLDGIGCSVCDAPVPAERIRVLAHRDDVTFLQLECRACGSTALGFISDAHLPPDARPGNLGEVPPAVTHGADPLSADDVLQMHRFLSGWQGDLRSLVDAGEHHPQRRGGSSTPA